MSLATMDKTAASRDKMCPIWRHKIPRQITAFPEREQSQFETTVRVAFRREVTFSNMMQWHVIWKNLGFHRDWLRLRKGHFLSVPAVSNPRDGTAKVTHGREYWFYLNRGFIIVTMRVASLWTERATLLGRHVFRDRTSNRYYEIMRDLSRRINNWTAFLLLCRHPLTAKRRLHQHVAAVPLSVCSRRLKSGHGAAAGQQHTGWLYLYLTPSIPDSPLIPLQRATSCPWNYIC